MGSEIPCASIDAGIRDWDVLPAPGVPLPGNDHNLAESKS